MLPKKGTDADDYLWITDKEARYPFRKSLKYQKSWAMVIFKWFVPGAVNAFCIFISMWLLHIATYEYVHSMTRIEKFLSSHHVDGLAHNSSMVDAYFQEFSSLRDPVARILHRQNLPLGFLDAVAAIFPLTFMLGIFLYDDLRLYTKAMFCNAFLALLKGTVDAMTVMPDSIGWTECKARLTPLGVSYMQQNHSMLDLLKAEAAGVDGHHLRWCSDMAISGHTYFTTIYALGLYEMARKITRNPYAFTPRLKTEGLSPEEQKREQRKLDKFYEKKTGSMRRWRCLIIFTICVLGIGEQLVEIYFVAADRFHYTVDLYLAVIVTFLVFTNVIPARVAKWWMNWRILDESQKQTRHAEELLLGSGTQADILIPVCCFPFCCFAGRHHTFDESHMMELVECTVHDEEGLWQISRQADLGEGVNFRRAMTHEVLDLAQEAGNKVHDLEQRLLGTHGP